LIARRQHPCTKVLIILKLLKTNLKKAKALAFSVVIEVCGAKVEILKRISSGFEVLPCAVITDSFMKVQAP